MLNPKDLDLTDPDVIKNLPKEFLEEMMDGRDPKEIPNKEGAKK